MAALTAHAVTGIERTTALFLRDVKGMAGETLGGRLWLWDAQDTAHLLADRRCKCSVSAGVLVLHCPSAVLILPYAALLAWLYTAVAAGCTAGTWPRVPEPVWGGSSLRRRCGNSCSIRWLSARGCQQSHQHKHGIRTPKTDVRSCHAATCDCDLTFLRSAPTITREHCLYPSYLTTVNLN